MVSTMKDKDLRDMANKVAGEFRSEADFEAFTKTLRKQFWESTLEGELDDHLGYEKHESRGNGSGNSRNGKGSKRREIGMGLSSPKQLPSSRRAQKAFVWATAYPR